MPRVVPTRSLGLGTSRSAVCVGFVEHGGRKSWSIYSNNG